MKVIEWHNKTEKHPHGVCEAATSIWLQKISESGISYANTITHVECDDLQEKCNQGMYRWTTGLLYLLGHKSSFNATDSDCVENLQCMRTVLNKLKSKDFCYINALNIYGGVHAVVVYKYQSNYSFFDPNYAIYIYEDSENEKFELARKILYNLMYWEDIAVHYGRIG